MSDHTIDWDRIRALYEQSDRWDSVQGDDLAHLIFFGSLTYSTTMDPSVAAGLRGLYERWVGETAMEQRRRLLLMLDEAVGNDVGTAQAFAPMIYAEPSLGLISRAGRSFALLHPLQDDDPLTGPSILRTMARAAEESNRKVGLLHGLLLLGDRRVLPLLDGCWNDLFNQEQVLLTRTSSDVVYAAVVEFFLTWLARASDYIVGGVAAAIGGLPPRARRPRVIDLDRAFPANGPNKHAPVRHLGEWTFSEYLDRIEPRLRTLMGREDGRHMYDEIVRVWSQDR